MSQNAAELCVLLVRDIYGEVSSRVVSVLLELGRLSVTQLVRQLKLPEKIVKQTLAVLIQQHLVVHFAHLETGQEVVYYECEWTQVYELLRAGRIIRAVEERFGSNGALIVSNLLQLGHARVSDFLAAYGTSTKKSKATMNGKPNAPTIEDDSSITSVEILKSVMADMMKERFLVQVQEHHMHIQTDTRNTLRAQLTSQLRKSHLSENKLGKEVDRQMKIKMKELADGDTSQHAGMKRKATPTSKPRSKKRQKVSIYDLIEQEEEEWEINENIVLRINHEKFLVLFRNAELVSLAESRHGKVSSQVYAELLKRLEEKYFRCHEPYPGGDEEDDTKKGIKLSVLELSKTFSKDIDLESSIVTAPRLPKKKTRKRGYSDDEDEDKPRPNGYGKKVNGKGKRRQSSSEDDDDDDISDIEELYDDDEEGIDAENRKKKIRMELLKQHMQLLAEDSWKFVRLESNRGLGEWSVNYKELGKLMRHIELEKVVEETFGEMGLRLLRIIKDKGKLEEKQIASIALLKQKEIRSILTGLQESGYLHLQEVPKTSIPQISRTYFLWFHDPDRAIQSLVTDTYKAMSRAIQRTNVERAKRASLLEKWERSDVQANVEEYLTTSEKRELEIWLSREEKLLGQLMRLDRTMMILRDF
ncbi:RNA polymerase III subunit RPC82-domain-containing protein [Tuber indicum]|nr:RNA polymerase III subunit RPC82-domain-containing protein [Tuber indicum]